MKNTIYLTTPEGHIGIDAGEIIAFAESVTKDVNCEVWLRTESDAFNILEDFDEIKRRLNAL